MKKLNTLSAISALLFCSQGVYALTPWATGYLAPDVTIKVSGAVAQTKAFAQTVNTVLAAPGSLDTFNDQDPVTGSVGSRWTAFYFTGSSSLPVGLAGKKILLTRRTAGGSGYGVLPLLTPGIPVEMLNIVGTKATNWTQDTSTTSGGATGFWKATISATNGSQYIKTFVPDGGVIAVDPYLLLAPGSKNYPDQQNQLLTGAPEAGWPTTVKALPANFFTVVPTGGLAYGVAVTLDLYKVLQAAQKRAGTLASTVTVGNYTESDMPTLHHNVIASLIAGKIGAWDQIKIVDKTGGTPVVRNLLDPAILADAGVTATPPAQESTTGKHLTPVALALRNNGAATSVIAYSVFLNYPSAVNGVAPASKTANDPVIEDASLPIVKEPIIISDTGTLLKDWQNGTNTLSFNNVPVGSGFAKRWGIAINTANQNSAVTATGTGGDPWRYIRIDGYAPTLENIAAGVYTYWAEGAVIYRTSFSTDPQWALKTTVLQALANNMASPAILGGATTTQAWGKTGGFATAATAGVQKYSTTLPFSSSSPVVPFSHFNNGGLHTEIVPIADSAEVGGFTLQMK